MARVDLLETRKWVLVPGTLCTASIFDPMLDELNVDPCNRHVVMVDASDVRHYAERLSSAVTGGEIVCGFSLGALVLAHNLEALKAAGAVVLLASNPFPDPPENRAGREAVRDQVQTGGASDWINTNWATMSTSGPGALRDFVAEMAEESALLIAAQTELAASRPGAVEQLRHSGLPLIFVTGAEDRLTPATALSEIVEAAKVAHLSVLKDLGHFALIEAPDRVADAIRAGVEALCLEHEEEG